MKKLSPEQFESLVFDLITHMGLDNAQWRTPGADGGRDIEAQENTYDFSGAAVQKRWFIECKRYKGSVDWPTIYGKLAYADSNAANYLLMCTPSKFTPNAITQANNWNAQRRDLKIRLWPGHELDRQLLRFPDIAAKYGLSLLPVQAGPSLSTLGLALAKTVSTYHGTLVFAQASIDPMLEAAQALSTLLSQRMADVASSQRIRPILTTLRLDGGWKITGGEAKIDHLAARAFFAYLYALSRRYFEVEVITQHSLKIAIWDVTAFAKYREVFDCIALWGDMELSMAGQDLVLRQRTSS